MCVSETETERQRLCVCARTRALLFLNVYYLDAVICHGNSFELIVGRLADEPVYHILIM